MLEGVTLWGGTSSFSFIRRVSSFVMFFFLSFLPQFPALVHKMYDLMQSPIPYLCTFIAREEGGEEEQKTPDQSLFFPHISSSSSQKEPLES